MRKAEGGVRQTAYKSCYNDNSTSKTRQYDVFLPIWWFSNTDKKEYEDCYKIEHSDCYKIYGLKRTGCAGCPFSLKIENDLSILQQFEPKLFHACMNIFGPSYAYKRAYYEFRENIKRFNKHSLEITDE